MRIYLPLFALLLFGGCATSLNPFPKPSEDGWLEIVDAGGACWDGEPYRFWFRPGSTQKLALWFQGGGACWNDALCAGQRRPFDGTIDERDHPALRGGLFDFDRTDNPIAGWSVLFLPYCTGDVHIGDRRIDYRGPDGEMLAFQHAGQQNVGLALDWLARFRFVPETLLVTGESAGAIAASYHVPGVSRRWPDARTILLTEAAGGYRSANINGVLEQWGALDRLPAQPAYVDRGAIDFESFYLAAAQADPDLEIAQINFAEDAVQHSFLALLGTPADQLLPLLDANFAEIATDAPALRTFTLSGKDHVVLAKAAAWSAACGEDALVDWVRALLEGPQPASVSCH